MFRIRNRYKYMDSDETSYFNEIENWPQILSKLALFIIIFCYQCVQKKTEKT